MAEVEAKLLKKTELETRVSNLEHDTQTLFDMVQTKLSQAQKETNENVSNIMGILQLFEEKQKHVVQQLDLVKQALGENSLQGTKTRQK